MGENDFRTSILKIERQGAKALINAGFEDDTLNTLKVLKEMNIDIPVGVFGDTVNEKVLINYPNQMDGAISYGFKPVDENFKDKLGEEFVLYEGAALAYTHIKQMVYALDSCAEKDMVCVREEMDGMDSDESIGFIGFENRIAQFDMLVKEY